MTRNWRERRSRFADSERAPLLRVVDSGGDHRHGVVIKDRLPILLFKNGTAVGDRFPTTTLNDGDLGTFDFPAGCHAYLGSAFGGNGVRARSHRHLTTDTPKRWDVDWLKPRCTPVAVWWTHERRHVEFDWAELLVDLPGATCPVARFGGNDNLAADAHLVRFDTSKDWCGRGWPE